MARVAPALMRSIMLGCAVLAAASSTTFAQGRGGGGGGRGGGGGGRGGGGGGGASATTPIDRIKDELNETDELKFLDARKKQLSLDKEQKESLKSLTKEMEEKQKPIFKDMEKTFADLQRNPSQAGGVFDGGGDGGDNTGTSGRAGRGGRGNNLPPGVRESMAKLTDIQSAFADRADVMLKDTQKHMADSLRFIYKDEMRDKAAKKARAGAGSFGGGGGGGGSRGGRGG